MTLGPKPTSFSTLSIIMSTTTIPSSRLVRAIWAWPRQKHWQETRSAFFSAAKRQWLLRPAPNHQFRVVGECYVHGFMNREAFLGPLPDHYQLVQVLDQTQRSSFWQFYNHRTGKTQFNDPRLEPPLDDDDVDPILTPETIEDRGVKLRTFRPHLNRSNRSDPRVPSLTYSKEQPVCNNPIIYPVHHSPSPPLPQAISPSKAGS